MENVSERAAFRAWVDWPRKLIFNDTTGRGEKYNLERNPGEEMRPRTRRKLPTEFLAAIDSVSAVNAQWRAGVEFVGEVPQPSEEEIEALRALGYIE
jgi:hypothetical protein